MCYELDTLVFAPAPDAPDEVDEVVAGLLSLEKRSMGGPDGPRVVEEVAWQEVTEPQRPEDPTSERALDSLLGLLELSLRASERWTTVPVLQSIGVDGISLDDPAATRRQALLLQEVLRARLLTRLIRDRLRELRRTYATRAERSRVIRGRIQTRTLFRAEVTGEVDCEFEEFSEVSPLFRVVRTALDLVVSNSIHWGWLATLPVAQEILDGACSTRAHLHHISSMPRAEAAKVASQLRLGRVLRRWEPVRALCASILADSPPGYGQERSGSDGSSAFVVDTAALWQALLDHAIRQMSVSQVEYERPALVDLWHGAPFRGKAVDSSLVYRGERWLVDAKYKEFPEDRVPSMSDQYQMFGYSHLYDDVVHVALVYPHAPWATGQGLSGPYPRGGSVRPCTLRLASAPFPHMHSPATFEGHWDQAVAGIQIALLGMLETKVRLATAS